MRQYPGFTVSVVLVTLALCLGIVLEVPWGVLAGLSVVLACQLAFLFVQAVRLGRRYYEMRRRDRMLDQASEVERLVTALASRDRTRAKTAARLLGELAAMDDGLSPNVFPPEEAGPAWERWNHWWVTNRGHSTIGKDKA